MAGRLAGGTAFWLVAAVGFSGVIALELTQDLPLAPEVSAAPGDGFAAEAVMDNAGTLRLPSADLIDSIIERPLFSPSRRPAAIAATLADTSASVEEGLALELVGTMLRGDDHVALLRHPSEGVKRLREGDSAGSWTIIDVQSDRVSFERGDRVDTLVLRKDVVKPQRLAGSGAAVRRDADGAAPNGQASIASSLAVKRGQ